MSWSPKQTARTRKVSAPLKSKSGAGDGNRTHVSSLGSYSSAIELHPQFELRSLAFNAMTLATNQLSRQLSLNGKPYATSAATVAALLDELGYAGKRVAVERNGEIVPKSLHGATALAVGDALEIVVAVGGG